MPSSHRPRTKLHEPPPLRCPRSAASLSRKLHSAFRTDVKDELADLVTALVTVIGAIVHSDPACVQRIAIAYRESRARMAEIARDTEGSHPRILVGFAGYEAAKAADDLAAMGWLLAAIEERLGECDLEGASELHCIVGGVARVLLDTDPTLH